MKIILILSLLSGVALATDWPTAQHDNRRSGVTADQLTAANLSNTWVFTSKSRPQPAWFGKMERDSYAKKTFQADTYDYDKAFNIIAADGKVFFASSSENACVALNDSTGAELWRSPAISAVRVAPTYDSGKIYFGADDGYAYCVNATDGSLVWKYRGAPSETMIASNHKFISRTPCRTGVLIDSGKAYCGFGLMSWNGNYMVKLNAITGVEETKLTLSKPYADDVYPPKADRISYRATSYSFEGMLLSDGTDLFVTQGRNAPASFKLNPLSLNGNFSGCGGTFATLSSSGEFFHGPGHFYSARVDHMQESTASTRAEVAKLNYVSRILVDNSGNRFAILRDSVKATGANTWTQGIEQPVTLILAGTTLYVGAKDQVVAIDSTNGTVLKILPVDGTAYSLAVANGKLFASTSTGKIYAFE